MEPQEQLYILYGVLGSLLVLLFILLSVLFVWISRLKKQTSGIVGGSSSGNGKSGDVLERRGFSEYKGSEVIVQPGHSRGPTLSRQMSAQHSVVGYPYNPTPISGPSSIVAKDNFRGYDNNGYEREQQRDVTAGGVRVLPSLNSMDHQQQRRSNYDNYY